MNLFSIFKLATIHSGYSYNKDSEPEQDPNTYIIQPKDVIADNVIDLNQISVKYNRSITFLAEGDVLVTNRSTFKASVFHPISTQQTVAALGIFIIRIKNPQELLPDFLAFWLNSIAGQSALEQIQLFTTTKSINKEDLLNIKIPIPAIETQQHYALLYKNYIKQKGLLEQLSDLNLKVINKISMSLQEQK